MSNLIKKFKDWNFARKHVAIVNKNALNKFNKRSKVSLLNWQKRKEQ